MSVWQLEPVSRTPREFAPMWFTDDACTWDDSRLHRVGLLQNAWQTPQLHLYRPASIATPVLFNPNAFAVSGTVRSELSQLLDGIEFLPVHIDEHGTYFIVHVVTCIEIPEGCDIHRPSNDGSPGNVVMVHSFPDSFASTHPVFRLLQPADSPFGQRGGCVRAIYLTAFGRQAVETVCSGLLFGAPLPAPLAHRGETLR